MDGPTWALLYLIFTAPFLPAPPPPMSLLPYCLSVLGQGHRSLCSSWHAGCRAGQSTVPSLRVPWWQSPPRCSPLFLGFISRAISPPQEVTRSSWSQVAPNPIGLCPHRRGTWTQTRTGRGQTWRKLSKRTSAALTAAVGRVWPPPPYSLGPQACDP